MNDAGGDVANRLTQLHKEIEDRQEELCRLNAIYEYKPLCASLQCLDCMFELANQGAPCFFKHNDPKICEYFVDKNEKVLSESKFYNTEISCEGLKLADACNPGRKKFKKEFGDEALLTTATMLRALVNGVEICWLFGISEKDDEWEEILKTAMSDKTHSDTLGKYYWIEHLCNNLCESIQPTVRRIDILYRRDLKRKERREKRNAKITQNPPRISMEQCGEARTLFSWPRDVMYRYFIQSDQARRAYEENIRLLGNSTIESNALQQTISDRMNWCYSASVLSGALSGADISADWPSQVTSVGIGGEQPSVSNLSTSERSTTIRASSGSERTLPSNGR